MRITALILAACMLLALLAGCSKQENSADTQDEVTLPMTEEQESSLWTGRKFRR